MFQSLKDNKIALSFLGIALLAIVFAFYQYAQVGSLRQEAARMRSETKKAKEESIAASRDLMRIRIEVEKARKELDAFQGKKSEKKNK